jgi:hypothetical protein
MVPSTRLISACSRDSATTQKQLLRQVRKNRTAPVDMQKKGSAEALSTISKPAQPGRKNLSSLIKFRNKDQAREKKALLF